jgi:hypothetical protein
MHKAFKIFIGLILFSMGAIVLVGWLLHIPIMVEFKRGVVPMVFNTALCFTLTGIALLLTVLNHKLGSILQIAIGTFLIVLCGSTFIEILLDRNFGIDLPSLHIWLGDGNIRPGRMAPNSALGFIIIGCTLILIPRVATRLQAKLAQTLTFFIFAIGLTGLVGYMLSPDLLYGWARSARMSVPTASGIILIATVLWLSWSNADWYSSRKYLHEDEKITFIGTAILMVLTITAGLAGFAAQQNIFEKSLQQHLQDNFNNRITLFHTAINQAITNAEQLTKNPALINTAHTISINAKTLEPSLAMELTKKLSNNFRGLVLQDAQKNEI